MLSCPDGVLPHAMYLRLPIVHSKVGRIWGVRDRNTRYGGIDVCSLEAHLNYCMTYKRLSGTSESNNQAARSPDQPRDKYYCLMR